MHPEHNVWLNSTISLDINKRKSWKDCPCGMNVKMGENGQSDHLSFINFSGCHLYCFYEVNFKWLERQREKWSKIKDFGGFEIRLSKIFRKSLSLSWYKAVAKSLSKLNYSKVTNRLLYIEVSYQSNFQFIWMPLSLIWQQFHQNYINNEFILLKTWVESICNQIWKRPFSWEEKKMYLF